MEIQYDDSEKAREYAERTRGFLDEVVIPRERRLLRNREGFESRDELNTVIEELREEARDRGVYAPQMPEEYGGQGLSLTDVLPTFEEAGRSLLGPGALRISAPDEGNMHTIELAGTDGQKTFATPARRRRDEKRLFDDRTPRRRGFGPQDDTHDGAP